MLSKHTIILVVGLVSFVGSARSQETSGRPAQNVDTGSGATNDTNGANNPVNPMLTIDLQNYLRPLPEENFGRIGDQGRRRVSVPIDEFGLHQFVRVILPIDTTATEQGGPNTGVGDLTVYDLVLFQAHGTTIGAGPLIAAPTARGFAYGSGKWQAGAAGIVLRPFGWGLFGVITTYEDTLSGNTSGP